MAYFILAVMAIIGIGGSAALFFSFIYALYLKYYIGDRRKLSEIFWSL